MIESNGYLTHNRYRSAWRAPTSQIMKNNEEIMGKVRLRSMIPMVSEIINLDDEWIEKYQPFSIEFLKGLEDKLHSSDKQNILQILTEAISGINNLFNFCHSRIMGGEPNYVAALAEDGAHILVKSSGLKFDDSDCEFIESDTELEVDYDTVPPINFTDYVQDLGNSDFEVDLSGLESLLG